MALFGLKRDTKKAPAKKAAKVVSAGKTVHAMKPEDAKKVLISPRVTEKAANLTARHVYTFNVAVSATKRSIADAVHAEYKVRPVKINVSRKAGKTVALRTRRGVGRKVATKKAYVYLKEGDRIEFAS